MFTCLTVYHKKTLIVNIVMIIVTIQKLTNKT